MYDMQHVKISTKDDNMEFIINRSQNAALSALTVTEVGHSKPKRGKRADEVSTFWQLHLVTSGNGLFRGHEICAGNAFLVIPGESQNMSVESDSFEQYWLNFDGTEAARLLRDLGIPNESHVLTLNGNGDGKTLAESLLADIFGKADDSSSVLRHSHTYLIGVLYQLLSLVKKGTERNSTVTDGYVSSVCSYIRAHYSEPLTVEWLSAVAGLSPKYLIRIFKRVTGMTVITYITKTRLEIAVSLLEGTDKSISEISRSVGYGDPLYFSKVFKGELGISPSGYRNEKGRVD